MDNNIRNRHAGSWRGILFILKLRKNKYKGNFLGCVIFTLLVTILACNNSKFNSFEFIVQLVDICIGIFPNLLGFSLGGLAIIVGFSNTELIKRNSSADKLSVYQLLNANFSFLILLQLLLVIGCLVIKIATSSLYFQIENFRCVYPIINIIAIFIIILVISFSCVLTPYIILNLFTLSQMNNLHYTIEKIKEDKKKEEPSPAAPTSTGDE